ncbi:MAG TPA: HNH endonuclease [Methanosarcinales archaeon]|nr:HNH endonuclease [Methanosarcinales archaeon]
MPKGISKTPELTRQRRSAGMKKHYRLHPEARENCRSNFLGENNPGWQGGVQRQPYPKEYSDDLREIIRERDNWTCQQCGWTQEQEGQLLPVHHIDYDKENSAEENLITLCHCCHSKTGFNREYWQIHFERIL